MKQRKVLGKPAKGEFIGYARVSTDDQSLLLQTDALKAVGCLNIYEEKRSGAANKRPKLDLAIADLRAGDTLVVWRIDRLARSGRELHRRLEQIEARGAAFKSLQEQFDFSTSMGKFILGVLGLVAELERQMTVERTKAGLDALKARGHQLGARRIVDDAMKSKIARLMNEEHKSGPQKGRRKYTNRQIAKLLGISEASLYGNMPGGRRGVIRAINRKKR